MGYGFSFSYDDNLFHVVLVDLGTVVVLVGIWGPFVWSIQGSRVLMVDSSICIRVFHSHRVEDDGENFVVYFYVHSDEIQAIELYIIIAVIKISV